MKPSMISENYQDNIYLTTIVYNQKLFWLYGNQEGRKTFLEFKKNILVNPHKDDLKKLNDIFNPFWLITNEEEYDLDYYLEKLNKQNNQENKKDATPSKKRKIDIVLEVQKKIIAVGLAVAITSMGSTVIFARKKHMSLTRLYSNTLLTFKSMCSDIFTSNEKVDNAVFMVEVQNALTENDNLSLEEKEFFINNFSKIISEYGNYMRQQHVLRNLNKLHIVYQKDISDEYIQDNRYATAQSLYGLEIAILKANSFAETSDSDLAHEFMHILHGRVKNNFGEFLNEGLTSQLTNEYLIKDNGYTTERMLTGMLSELVGKETLLKCYFECDYDELINKLTEITNDKKEAIRLISLGDVITSLGYETVKGQKDIMNNQDTEEKENYENNKVSLEQALNEFITLYEKYYVTKTNQNLKNNTYLAACVDSLLQTNNLQISPELIQGINMYFVERNYLDNDSIFNCYVKYGPNANLQGSFTVDNNSPYAHEVIENAYTIIQESKKDSKIAK